VYSVGMQAVKAVQKQETLLWQVAETLSAPLEKLDKTAERLVKDLKEANVEKKKLLKELTAKESQNAGVQSSLESQEEINGVKLLKRDFQDATDVNRMVQTATEIIKHNEAVVTLFYSADAKSAKIMIMAGTQAIAKGANAGNAVKEAAPIFGGGGGGRPNFAQGGGTKPEKLPDAIKTAEEAIKKQLNH
jgi:alanyl-tRNA synthetase